MPQPRATKLHVSPAIREVADTDKMALTFYAHEDIVTGSATLEIQNPYEDVTDLIQSTIIDDEEMSIRVVIAGLTRGISYELSIIFERADTTKWTRLLTLSCVA